MELPLSIYELEHLRYLNLSHNPITSIPDSIGNHLIYLQTLLLNNCLELEALPKLGNFRHLQFRKCPKIACMPPNFGGLTNLQTLSGFVIDKREGCKIVELKGMTFLKGSLHLSGIENVKDETEAQGANLNMKPGLEEVELEWTSLTNPSDAEIFLTHIQFHGNLRKLVITGYCGVTFPPDWLNHSPVSKLKSIRLQGCTNCSLLPLLGHLHLLESLFIGDMPVLKCIEVEFFQGFQSLKALQFSNMLKLEKLANWEEKLDMPSLGSLSIIDCPILQSLPKQLPGSLTKLEIKDCPIIVSLPKPLPGSLLKLEVKGSKILEEECEKGLGDWLSRGIWIDRNTSLTTEPAPGEV